MEDTMFDTATTAPASDFAHDFYIRRYVRKESLEAIAADFGFSVDVVAVEAGKIHNRRGDDFAAAAAHNARVGRV